MHWRLQRTIDSAERARKRIRFWLWNFRAARFPRDERGLVRLHVGCGEIDARGFVNVDARVYPHVHIVTRNLFDLKAVPDGVASLVYMCHVLEHVSFREVHRVLVEMRRILAPQGVLRLSVPDFDLILDIYEHNGREPASIVGPLMGGQDYAFNFHYNVFTRRSLSAALVKAGYEDVKPWDPLACEHHDFEDWASRPVEVNGRRFPVSLNLEAKAPPHVVETSGSN